MTQWESSRNSWTFIHFVKWLKNLTLLQNYCFHSMWKLVVTFIYLFIYSSSAAHSPHERCTIPVGWLQQEGTKCRHNTQHLHKWCCGCRTTGMKGSQRKRRKISAILQVLSVVFIWTPLLRVSNFNTSIDYSSRSKRMWEKMKSPAGHYENTFTWEHEGTKHPE